MPKFEYTVEAPYDTSNPGGSNTAQLDAKLNDLGEKGWQLVGRASNDWLIMMREVVPT